MASLTIGNGLIKIDSRAFEACDIPFVVSFIENPFKTKITSDTFSKNTVNNATLYVPEGSIDKYRATSWWQIFVFIEEGTGGSNPPPTPQKCEKPTISYMNGKLTFNCETEGAICHSTITDTDIKSYNDVEVQLSVTYNISIYATKAGYENSDVATAALCWIDANPKTEGIESSVAQVRANPILIQTNNGEITVTGADDGASISAYSISGRIIASKLSNGSDTKLITDLKRGEVVIIKINEKTVKLIMQ